MGSEPVTIPARSRPRARLGGRLAGAASAGLGIGLSFPPYGWWPLLAPGLAALTLLTRGARLRTGAAVGAIAGLGCFLVLLRWAAVIGNDAWLALAALEAAAWVLVGIGLVAVQRLRAWPVWAATVWVGVELLRAEVPFGGFPWGRLAFAVTDTPLLAWAAVAGAPGLSFVVALAAQLLALAVLAVTQAVRERPTAARRPRAWAVAAAALGGAAALVAGASVVPLGTDGPTTTVAAVQGNVPGVGMDFLGEREAVLRNHVAATERLAAQVRSGRLPAPAFVVWPENSSDIDPFRDPQAYRLIDGAVRDIGVPVLVGTLVDRSGSTTTDNTGIVWDPVTGPGQRYVKRHPVPFGEYIPFRSLIGGWFTRFQRIPRDFTAGDRPGVLQLDGAKLGDLICFEVAYDDLVHDVVTGGAQLLVVQTNNATYGLTGQPAQQFAISRLRAVETGRAVVVAATSGISGVVTPDGVVRAETRQLVPAILVEQVPLRTATTLATRLGAWPELILAAAALIAIVVGLRRGPALPQPTTPARRTQERARTQAVRPPVPSAAAGQAPVQASPVVDARGPTRGGST